MGDIKKNTNELIRIRKKRKLVRRTIFFIVITIISVVILCLKLPYFNISEIVVENNKLVKSEEIEKLSEISLGSNIFNLSKDKVSSKILSNPYVSEVRVKRQLPSIAVLEVKERIPQYYISRGKQYVILDTAGYVLQTADSIADQNLVQLSGVDASKAFPGNPISTESRKLQQIEVFSDLMGRSLSDTRISAIDLEGNSEIKVYFNNIMVKAGSIEGMQDKLNKAINIIDQQNLKNLKGYIDVSFDGAPVISVEN
jgi:cell division protein FtsQ